MKKIAINIADQQDVRIKELARRLGITQAELFRRFLEEGLVREERHQAEHRPKQGCPHQGDTNHAHSS